MTTIYVQDVVARVTLSPTRSRTQLGNLDPAWQPGPASGHAHARSTFAAAPASAHRSNGRRKAAQSL
eukprot:1555354-Pyramimonas_sp.AAC.1